MTFNPAIYFLWRTSNFSYPYSTTFISSCFYCSYLSFLNNENLVYSKWISFDLVYCIDSNTNDGWFSILLAITFFKTRFLIAGLSFLELVITYHYQKPKPSSISVKYNCLNLGSILKHTS